MITKIILERILICNRTNKKFTEKKSCWGLATGNFENSKLFEGLVILIKNKEKPDNHNRISLLFSFILSLLFSSLLFSSLLFSSLVSHLAFSCLSSCLLLFSLSLSVCLSVCLSPCVVVCCSVLFCVVVCCCGVWCVWCGTLENPVCPLKTSPCVRAPRAHVETHVRVVPAWTGTFWMYTRARFEWTHGGEGEGHRQFCLPKFDHMGLSRSPEVHRKKPLDVTYFQFENRSRITCSRVRQPFALPDEAVQLQLSWGTLRWESAVRFAPFTPPSSSFHTYTHTRHTITNTQHTTHKHTHTHRRTRTHKDTHTNAHAHAHVPLLTK